MPIPGTSDNSQSLKTRQEITGDKSTEMGRGQIMKGFVWHDGDNGLFTREGESVTLFKQSCDTVILESSSGHSGGFTWI